jgi:hypothetical protein
MEKSSSFIILICFNEYLLYLLEMSNINDVTHLLIPQGSISPNFFCQVKSLWRTVFDKKVAVEFHQQIKLQISF